MNTADLLLEELQFRNNWLIVLVPIALMAIDFITGTLNAWSKGEIKSYKMRQGLTKKAGEIAILVLGETFRYALTLPVTIMTGIAVYVIIMELISILENIDKMGVPIPKFVKNAISNANDDMLNTDLTDEQIKKIEEILTHR